MKIIYKNINNNYDKKNLKDLIDNMETPFSICIGEKEEVKTHAQLRYFNKLCNDFATMMQELNLSELSSGDWKAEIKRQAHFYQANTGITSMQETTKKKMWNALKTAKDNQGNKLFDEYELSMIIVCFNEMKLKSCKDADKKEMINLVIEAHILIITILAEQKNIKEILNQYADFKEFICKWYNDYINSDFITTDNKQEILKDLFVRYIL